MVRKNKSTDYTLGITLLSSSERNDAQSSHSAMKLIELKKNGKYLGHL